ncbi:MAG: hypothetical protein JWM34_1185 [Ilumatobacteraceae bacterium]|nr:hypothetical protein [Ilumatobacteraceae bacterium]
MTRIISTWYYEQPREEGGTYAQVPGKSWDESFRDVYRRCIPVFFATARLANPDATLLLYLNRPWTNSTPTARQAAGLLAQIGVETVVIDYDSAPPTGWPGQWRNQFFVLDVLRSLNARSADDDAFVVLDSDVVWNGNPSNDDFWAALQSTGSLTYDLQFGPEHVENGLASPDLARVYTDLTGDPTPPISYIGGELQAFRGDVGQQVGDLADRMWQQCQQRFADGQATIGEEAHLLSLVYTALGLAVGSANPFMKRCWTQATTYLNIDGSEGPLAIWHVPSEKRFGLRRVFADLSGAGFVAWGAQHRDDMPTYLGGRIGIRGSSPVKTARDLVRKVAGRAHSSLT